MVLTIALVGAEEQGQLDCHPLCLPLQGLVALVLHLLFREL